MLHSHDFNYGYGIGAAFDAGFKEEDHPRDEDGKFGSGGGGKKAKAAPSSKIKVPKGNNGVGHRIAFEKASRGFNDIPVEPTSEYREIAQKLMDGAKQYMEKWWGKDNLESALLDYKLKIRASKKLEEGAVIPGPPDVLGHSTVIEPEALKLVSNKISVSREERKAVDAYFGANFGFANYVNEVARGVSEPNEGAKETIDGLNSMLDRSKAVAPGRVYRVISDDQFAKSLLDKVGESVTINGYSSTTKSEQYARGFKGASQKRLLMKIDYPEGSKLLDADGLVSNSRGEHEVLFPDKARFKILSTEDDPEGDADVKVLHLTYEEPSGDAAFDQEWVGGNPDVKARAAGVIFITPDDQVLMLKRSDKGDHAGAWCFPGGMCEGAEQAFEAALREAEEETGYQHEGDIEVLHRALNDDGLEYTTFIALVPEPFEPELNSESENADWFPLDDLPEPLHPGITKDGGPGSGPHGGNVLNKLGRKTLKRAEKHRAKNKPKDLDLIGRSLLPREREDISGDAEAKAPHEDVDYGPGKPESHCSICKYYLEGPSCKLVEDPIEANGWCKLFDLDDCKEWLDEPADYVEPTEIGPIEGSPADPDTPRFVAARTGIPEIDRLLEHPLVRALLSNPVVDRSHTEPYMAGASDKLHDPTVYIDEHVPREQTVRCLNDEDGYVTFDPAWFWIIHENIEILVMTILIREGFTPELAYKCAHYLFAEPAEGAAYKFFDIDQKAAEKEQETWEPRIQRENADRVPKNLYRKPYPHGHIRDATKEPIEEFAPSKEEAERAMKIVRASPEFTEHAEFKTTTGAMDEFRESDHPRRKDGKFGTGGGGSEPKREERNLLGPEVEIPSFMRNIHGFHGTTHEVVENIKKEGLKPSGAPGGDAWAKAHGMMLAQTFKSGGRQFATYLSSDFDTALTFAKYASEVRGQRPTILELNIPASEARGKLRFDRAGDETMFTFDGVIKPEWIGREIPLYEDDDDVEYEPPKKPGEDAVKKPAYIVVFDLLDEEKEPPAEDASPKVTEYAERLRRAYEDNDEFDRIVAQLQADRTVNTADMNELKHIILGYQTSKKGRGEALQKIRDHQMLDARQKARARNIDKHMKPWGGDAEFKEEEHPRDEGGKFSSGGGGGGAKQEEAPEPKSSTELSSKYSKQAKIVDGVIHTSNVDDAVLALYEDRKVELDQPRQVTVLLDKLASEAKRMISEGQKEPIFNLCNVTVAKTNLFCADSHGIPRIKMPQLDEGPGGADGFKNYLQEQGYKVEDTWEKAQYLRATQNELNGAQVAALAKIFEQGQRRPYTVFVSRDNYIIDGHHRWAAEIGVEYESGKDVDIHVERIDGGIIELLAKAKKFTGGKGMVGVGQRQKIKGKGDMRFAGDAYGYGLELARDWALDPERLAHKSPVQLKELARLYDLKPGLTCQEIIDALTKQSQPTHDAINPINTAKMRPDPFNRGKFQVVLNEGGRINVLRKLTKEEAEKIVRNVEARSQPTRDTFDAFHEEQHPRGQPGNAGQFSSGGGGGAKAHSLTAGGAIKHAPAGKKIKAFMTNPTARRAMNKAASEFVAKHGHGIISHEAHHQYMGLLHGAIGWGLEHLGATVPEAAAVTILGYAATQILHKSGLGPEKAAAFVIKSMLHTATAALNAYKHGQMKEAMIGQTEEGDAKPEPKKKDDVEAALEQMVTVLKKYKPEQLLQAGKNYKPEQKKPVKDAMDSVLALDSVAVYDRA